MAGEKILVVDDDPGVLASCQRILAHKGYRVEGAGNGYQAIERAEDELFDLLLVDIRMPGMNGLETYQAIKEFNPDIIGVIITGYASMETAIEAIKLGFDGFLIKPFSLDELYSVVAKALERQNLRRENTRLMALIPLFEMSNAFMTTMDLDELLNQVVHVAKRETKTDRVSLMLLDEASGELTIEAAIGLPQEVVATTRIRPGEGIAGWVAERGEPLLLDDKTPLDPKIRKAMKSDVVTSALCVPLKIKDRVIGVLNLSKLDGGSLAEGDLELTSVLCGQAAIAIENARLYGETGQREKEARALYELTKLLTSLDYQQIIDTLLGQPAQLMDCHVASLLLADTGSANITSRVTKPVSAGFVQEVQRRLLDSYETLSGQEADRVIVDLQGEAKTIDDEAQKVQSFLIAPLIARDRVLGMLSLSSSLANAYTENDARLLSTVSHQATTALENARLFADLERAKAELERWSEELEMKVKERTEELKEAQERLLHAQRLAAIGQVGASVCHELGNPLGAINNSVYYLNMMLRDADGKLKKHIEIINTEIARAKKITRDLLSLTEGEEPTLQEVQINTIVRDALARTPGLDKVAVITELGEDLPPLMADPDQIEQMFTNVILNAVQAMTPSSLRAEPQAEGSVKTPDGAKLEITTKAEDGFMVTEFKDNGCGIPDENLEKIFEPLFSTKVRGVGLGLPLSKKIVEAHGGSIEVESPSTLRQSSGQASLRTGETGKGSTFTVRLPMGGGKEDPWRKNRVS
jgi:signal transduction histidine kinase/CheY-like chemotaxis protein